MPVQWNLIICWSMPLLCSAGHCCPVLAVALRSSPPVTPSLVLTVWLERKPWHQRRSCLYTLLSLQTLEHVAGNVAPSSAPACFTGGSFWDLVSVLHDARPLVLITRRPRKDLMAGAKILR